MPGEPSTAAAVALAQLLAPLDKQRFYRSIRRLHTMFNLYAATCPEPLPAPGLIVTPEIRTQCERYLPITDITAIFNRLYAAALTYQPVLSSTPFHHSMSWADSFAALPTQFQASANPGRLLESLLDDDRLLTAFLFASFLPNRFYGCIGRYPRQMDFIRTWLETENRAQVRCLDAACGTGEDTYGLALLLAQEGFSPEQTCIEGWTVEPLETWAATFRRFPHDRKREQLFRDATHLLFEPGCQSNIRFHCVDLTNTRFKTEITAEGFDLIICNGLLGGPIINSTELLALTIGNMAKLLAPGGILLAADNFHGGWKQKCPQKNLRALFKQSGLDSFAAGEGIGGLKPD